MYLISLMFKQLASEENDPSAKDNSARRHLFCLRNNYIFDRFQKLFQYEDEI